MVDIVKNVRIEGDKVSGNAKVSGLDKYTDVTINGQKITSDGSYNYAPNVTTSSNEVKNTVTTHTSTNTVENSPTNAVETKKVVIEEKKDNAVETKKVVSEEKKDKRSFWQRHPWLRVLLTIALCLLLIGLLMIALYHIMHAINNSKKNDEIKDAENADKELKDAKAAKDTAETAKTDAENAKQRALMDRDNALTGKNSAEIAKNSAEIAKNDAESNLSTAGFTDAEINEIKNGTFSSSSLTPDQQNALDSYNNAVNDYNTKNTAYNNAVNDYNTKNTAYNSALADYNDKNTAYNNAVNDFNDSEQALSDIAKDNGVTYDAGTTTLDDIKSGINTTYANKFPKSNGAFRIVGDSLALAGGVGALGTGLAGLIGNAVTKDDSKKVVTENGEVDVVNNNPAEKNTKTVTQTTTTVTK